MAHLLHHLPNHLDSQVVLKMQPELVNLAPRLVLILLLLIHNHSVSRPRCHLRLRQHRLHQHSHHQPLLLQKRLKLAHYLM
jgi:hypothetical protein